MIAYTFLWLDLATFAMWTYLSNSLYSGEFIITKTEKSNEACILTVEKCNPWEKSYMRKCINFKMGSCMLWSHSGDSKLAKHGNEN